MLHVINPGADSFRRIDALSTGTHDHLDAVRTGGLGRLVVPGVGGIIRGNTNLIIIFNRRELWRRPQGHTVNHHERQT